MHSVLEKAILVHVYFPAGKMEEDLEEFKELTLSAGAEILDVQTTRRSAPDAKYFIGSGKAQDIADLVRMHDASLVIFNHALSPAQERNLERLIKCRVLDRTGLILDIFAQRARSFEGKLQVELALLKHLSTRLVRIWTHLERQRGGIGLRGPGETQLETDRRLLRHRIKVISARLDKLAKQRALSRRARRKATVPTVALVGYTNAGKSTLFNQLSSSDVYAADQLFATLDPTLRRVEFAGLGSVILGDTVGFIRHLPHDLVNAFHATLEEVAQADLLLHVVDAHDENKNLHIEQVGQVLREIGADKVPMIEVHNKIDLLSNSRPSLDYDDAGEVRRVYISASKQQGFDLLVQAIAQGLRRHLVEKEVVLLPSQAKLRAELYQREAVRSEAVDEQGCFHLIVSLPSDEYDQIFGKR